MSALIDQGDYKKTLRDYHVYVLESTTRINGLARKSAKRMVVEYAELLMANPLFTDLNKETRSEISSSFFKNKVELMLEDENI